MTSCSRATNSAPSLSSALRRALTLESLPRTASSSPRARVVLDRRRGRMRDRASGARPRAGGDRRRDRQPGRSPVERDAHVGIACRDVRGQVATARMAGRPPQAVPRARAAVARAVRDLGRQRDDAVEDRAPRLGAHLRARLGGDRLGRRPALCGGERAVLEPERGGVAGGEHRRRPRDAGVLVDDHEPVRVVLEVTDLGGGADRQRDDAVGSVRVHPLRARVQLDTRLRRAPWPIAAPASAPERLERLLLGGHEHDLAPGRTIRGDQRQLVRVHRPPGAGRDRERRAARRSALELAHEPREQRVALRAAGPRGYPGWRRRW